MIRQWPVLLVIALVGCVGAPTYSSVVNPDVEQSVLYAQRTQEAATIIAREHAAQAMQMTATRVREREVLSDDLTRAAAPAAAVATQIAATPTAFALMATQTAYAFNGLTTQEAHSVSVGATQAALVREGESTRRWGWVGSVVVLVIAALILVIANYLHQLAKVHIASLKFRPMGQDAFVQLTYRDEWEGQRLPPPQLLAQSDSDVTIDEPRESIAERARKAWMAQNDAEWARFYRRLVMWVKITGGWTHEKLVSRALGDTAWREVTADLVNQHILIRRKGKNRETTEWHPDWSIARFEERQMHLYLAHPPSASPDIAEPPITLTHPTPTHLHTPPQQGEIILFPEG